MLMRDPSYLTQMSERMEDTENEKSEISPLIISQQRPSELSKTKQSEKCEISPLVSQTSGAPTSNDSSKNTVPIRNGKTAMNSALKETTKCCSLWDKFGFFLLTDLKFVMFLICVCMTNISHVSLHWFIPDRAIEVGLSNHDAAMTITVVNIANILSRLTFGTTSSDNFARRIVILCVYVFISGLHSICVFCLDHVLDIHVIFWFYGLLRGLFVIYMLLVVVDILGKDHVSLGLGLLHTLTGILFLISIPIFGHLNEVTHSYVMTFILYGSLEIIRGLFLVTIPVYVCWKSFKGERYIPLVP